MPNWLFVGLVYSTPLLVFLLVYFFRRKKHHSKSIELLDVAIADGLTEAASLHPVIDPVACVGCGSCVSACPEHNVLGLIHRKAELINPSNCIGHGACKVACPEQAIKLVFGSATRGVEIPDVKENYETCVDGIFIAGELGGMGLIRNAMEQGRQALDSVAKYAAKVKNPNAQALDCIIVGSGPAGMSATLGAKEHGLKSITIDQEAIGGTIAHFPKGKLVMTQAATLPLVGKVMFGEIRKEPLMQFWNETIDKYSLKIQQEETLLSVEKTTDGMHKVTTSKSEYISKSVLLAIGRRGSPRKLGVPGEELSKVIYRLTDPDQFKGKLVLVVGGGDSAIEAACSIADLNSTDEETLKVSLSYRKDNFGRAKAKNRQRVDDLVASGQLRVLFSSQVKQFTDEYAVLTLNDKDFKMKNDAVIVCAGGILPTKLLKDIGIKVEMKYGTE